MIVKREQLAQRLFNLCLWQSSLWRHIRGTQFVTRYSFQRILIWRLRNSCETCVKTLNRYFSIDFFRALPLCISTDIMLARDFMKWKSTASCLCELIFWRIYVLMSRHFTNSDVFRVERLLDWYVFGIYGSTVNFIAKLFVSTIHSRMFVCLIFKLTTETYQIFLDPVGKPQKL